MATEFRGITPELYHAIIAIVDQRMAEIKVTRADFDDLKDVVKELAEAQKRTEYKLEELAEAQKRTEARLEELAEAQKRTEAELQQLARQVGSLSATMGFGLEI
ncbi:Uncharacterized [Moorella glycerini]|uniref:Uncharacterized protein n=1 Tax=Neomoorella stamsii TaxID=1266720 RepID=A0A9X7P5R5_9FIRM|nr:MULTISPECIES: hypothetical protein [Moorella]PRR71683.1 hypothetical protein MOST_22480 [Moorella stamsii]CEP66939.1 Uncharacterized [Moorella glycerini]